MKTNTTEDGPDTLKLENRSEHAGAFELAAEALAGAAIGATTGILGGPPGMIAGAVIGGAVGAAAGAVLHEDRANLDAVDAQLDRDIGVTGGNLGEALPDAPKSKRGVFHAASMGVGEGSAIEPSEGPMQNLSQD